MYRLLVVDDEEKIRVLVRKYAEYEGYEVEEAADGMSAIELCRQEKFDLIILDVMMPELDGFSACREIRKFSQVPVLMLRVQAILKRSNSSIAPNKEILEFEGLKIDFTGRLVYVNEEKVNLSPKEYELLFYLVRNRGIALTREKLINDVWGYDFFGDDRTLDTHIKLLRKALGEYSRYIVTLRGVGYRFEG